MSKKIFLGKEVNGHLGKDSRGYEQVHGVQGFGE